MYTWHVEKVNIDLLVKSLIVGANVFNVFNTGWILKLENRFGANLIKIFLSPY